jgi:hypothetical protein
MTGHVAAGRSIRCPQCGSRIEHVPFAPGETLEHWRCVDAECGAVFDVSDVDLWLEEEPAG